jgi:hypothetical protein
MEYSLVPVPSNANSLSPARARELRKLKNWAERSGPPVDHTAVFVVGLAKVFDR